MIKTTYLTTNHLKLYNTIKTMQSINIEERCRRTKNHVNWKSLKLTMSNFQSIKCCSYQALFVSANETVKSIPNTLHNNTENAWTKIDFFTTHPHA